MERMTDEEREEYDKAQFITALYPADDIFVLWHIDKTDDDFGKFNYGAEHAQFMALCADEVIRAVVLEDGSYDLYTSFESRQCRGFFSGANLARYMPNAKIVFWDGSKDPRKGVMAHGDADA